MSTELSTELITELNAIGCRNKMRSWACWFLVAERFLINFQLITPATVRITSFEKTHTRYFWRKQKMPFAVLQPVTSWCSYRSDDAFRRFSNRHSARSTSPSTLVWLTWSAFHASFPLANKNSICDRISSAWSEYRRMVTVRNFVCCFFACSEIISSNEFIPWPPMVFEIWFVQFKKKLKSEILFKQKKCFLLWLTR